ncbi:MAG: hypothetical protein LBI71_03465 [Enterobacteriaceae bacterium]|jgi:hypothetical protein|nr:hypothetical protein [Enterobacteriaceae bacterium]
MKNRKFERNRRLAKQYQRNRHDCQFEQGILIYHDYSERDQNELSWWDDVSFILGSVRVMVDWQHPRYVYHNLIDEAAHNAVPRLQQDKENKSWFSKPKYKKVGRSRKKVHYHTLQFSEDSKKWFAALSAEKARLRKEADFTLYPSMKVEMLPWCRYVTLVAPIEVRNAEELHKLADMVRRILKRETTLEAEFPDYTYGKAQWIADGLADQPD